VNFLNRISFLALFFHILPFYTEASSLFPIANLKVSVINQNFSEQERVLTHQIKDDQDNISFYSKRGDTRLFLGKFSESRYDYEKMIQLNPLLNESHWRLGIAYFYLSDFKKAARQFEIYHNYDSVDRENGIWRFMSQYKESGIDYARKGLLSYEKDDRPPYPWLYSMFSGTLSSDEVFQKIKKASFPEKYQTRVLFHANLYVGIFLELTEDSPHKALLYLSRAVSNEYGKNSGTYMWQVARLHYSRLLRSVKKNRN
jgi:lipoprotein NlpI